MHARAQPWPLDQGALRHSCAGNDVGLRHRRLQIIADGNVKSGTGQEPRQPFGAFTTVVPQRHARNRPHAGMGAHQAGGQRASPHHQQMAGIGARQKSRRQGRSRCGAQMRQPRAVEYRQRCPGLARLQHIDAKHCGQAEAGIAWKDVDDFGAEPCAARRYRASPGGHQQMRRCCGTRAKPVMVAGGREKISGKCRSQRIDQAGKIQMPVNLVA